MTPLQDKPQTELYFGQNEANHHHHPACPRVSPQAITCRHNARMKKGHLYELPFQRLHKPDGASL